MGIPQISGRILLVIAFATLLGTYAYLRQLPGSWNFQILETSTEIAAIPNTKQLKNLSYSLDLVNGQQFVANLRSSKP
ncbi:unnamed protein product, partial [Allacma fusca]